MYVFFPVSRPSTSLPSFKTDDRVDYPDLSLHQQAGLARKEYEKSKEWAEDGLLLQLIESTVNAVSGKEGYSNSNPFHTERFANGSVLQAAVYRSRSDGEELPLEEASATEVQTMRPS